MNNNYDVYKIPMITKANHDYMKSLYRISIFACILILFFNSRSFENLKFFLLLHNEIILKNVSLQNLKNM